MIIYGTRGVTMTSGKGSFHCPACSIERPYRRRSVRRFFTLYFIPLIPLDVLEEYVECGACLNQFSEEAVYRDPAIGQPVFEAEMGNALRRMLAILLTADGTVDAGQKEASKEAHYEFLGTAWSDDDIQGELGQVRNAPSEFLSNARILSNQLEPAARSQLLDAMLTVVLANGDVQNEERALLGNLARTLQIPLSELSQRLQQMRATALA